MYNYIKGKITQITANAIILENNNIGYIIKTPNPYSYNLDSMQTVYTHLYIREDICDLYGFKTQDERDLFLKLISVRGLGPKGALAIIANDDLNRLKDAISSSDAKYLQKFPGIGPKASSQIILDLKGKLDVSKLNVNPSIQMVLDALKSLGYNSSELKKLDNYLLSNKDLPTETLIKESLKRLI